MYGRTPVLPAVPGGHTSHDQADPDQRDPTILIKAESTTVEEGQAARFIVERLWHEDLLTGIVPDSETVVALRASQNGQYITGALPAEIAFGQNETRKVIELQTVGDEAFGDDGSVTIELLPDTTGAGVNLQGKYTTWKIWQGHTPEGAGPTGPPSPSPMTTTSPASASPRRRRRRATQAAPT